MCRHVRLCRSVSSFALQYLRKRNENKKQEAVPHTLHLHAPEILEWRLDYGEQGTQHGLCEADVFNSVCTTVTSVLSYAIMQVGTGNNLWFSALEYI